jgi:hypothetical protein
MISPSFFIDWLLFGCALLLGIILCINGDKKRTGHVETW